MRSEAAEAAIRDGAAPVILVTIRSKVATWRVASEAILVTDRNGGASPLQFHPGIQAAAALTTTYDAFAVHGSTPTSVDVSAVLPDPDSAVSLGASWYEIAASVVDVALIWPGQDYADRTPVVEGGRVAKLSEGVCGQPSEIVVEGLGPTTGTSSVDGSRTIGEDYPSTGFTTHTGKNYPIPVGRCYAVPAFKVGVPTYTGGETAAILAGVKCPLVQTTDLQWYEDGAAVSFSETLWNVTEAGGAVSGEEFAASRPLGGAFAVGTGAYTIDFAEGAVTAHRCRDRSAVGGSDVVEWLLGNSGADIDWDATEPALSMLADWEIGLYLDREADNLTVLRERVIPMLPLKERTTAKGIALDYIDPIGAPAGFDLVVGQDLLDNTSTTDRTDVEAVRNVFLLEYAYDSGLGAYGKRLRLGGASASHPDERCRYSAQVFGSRVASTLQTSLTWDQFTARRMLQWQALRLALPRRLLTYDCDPSLYWLEAGMVGRVTDASRNLTRALAIIRTWRPAGSPFRAGFEFIDRPPVSRI